MLSAGELLAVENLLGYLFMANDMTCLAMSVTMNVSFDLYYSRHNAADRNCILPSLSTSYILS